MEEGGTKPVRGFLSAWSLVLQIAVVLRTRSLRWSFGVPSIVYLVAVCAEFSQMVYYLVRNRTWDPGVFVYLVLRLCPLRFTEGMDKYAIV